MMIIGGCSLTNVSTKYQGYKIIDDACYHSTRYLSKLSII